MVYKDPDTGVVRVHEGLGDEERDVTFAEWTPPVGAVGFAGIVFGEGKRPLDAVDPETGPRIDPGVSIPDWVGARQDDKASGGDPQRPGPVPEDADDESDPPQDRRAGPVFSASDEPVFGENAPGVMRPADAGGSTVVPLREAPKIMPHEHIEGTVAPEVSWEIARRNGIELRHNDVLIDSVETWAALHRFTDFPSFLQMWRLVTGVLRTDEDFRQIVVEYAATMKAHGVVYAEIDFSPIGRTLDGVFYDEMFEGIYAGIVEAEAQHGVIIRMTPSLVWGVTAEQAEECVRWAGGYRHRYVVGLSIGGNEMLSRDNFTRYDRAFTIAREEYGLGIVPHLGEVGDSAAISAALLRWKPARIRHGVSLKIAGRRQTPIDEAIVARLIEQGIVLDLAITSNLLTGAVKTLEDHPLPYFLDAGVRCTISTDDPALMDTDPTKEYALAAQLGLSLAAAYWNGVHGALCDEETRQRLIVIGEQAFGNQASPNQDSRTAAHRPAERIELTGPVPERTHPIGPQTSTVAGATPVGTSVPRASARQSATDHAQTEPNALQAGTSETAADSASATGASDYLEADRPDAEDEEAQRGVGTLAEDADTQQRVSSIADAQDRSTSDTPFGTSDGTTLPRLPEHLRTRNQVCGALVQRQMKDFLGPAGDWIEEVAINAVLAERGMSGDEFAMVFDGDWAEQPFGRGRSGLEKVIDHVENHGGGIAGVMEFGEKGAHAFAVFRVTQEYADRHPELELRDEVGKVVVYDNAAGGLLRGTQVTRWLAEAEQAEAGTIHGVILRENGQPDRRLNGGRPTPGRGPVGRRIGDRPGRGGDEDTGSALEGEPDPEPPDPQPQARLLRELAEFADRGERRSLPRADRARLRWLERVRWEKASADHYATQMDSAPSVTLRSYDHEPDANGNGIGQGSMTVAYGVPETADRVVWFAADTAHSEHRLTETMATAADFYDTESTRQQQEDPTRTVAVVAVLRYDDTTRPEGHWADVLEARDRAGGERLAQSILQSNAARRESSGHRAQITMWGAGYGGDLVLAALAGGQLSGEVDTVEAEPKWDVLRSATDGSVGAHQTAVRLLAADIAELRSVEDPSPHQQRRIEHLDATVAALNRTARAAHRLPGDGGSVEVRALDVEYADGAGTPMVAVGDLDNFFTGVARQIRVHVLAGEPDAAALNAELQNIVADRQEDLEQGRDPRTVTVVWQGTDPRRLARDIAGLVEEWQVYAKARRYREKIDLALHDNGNLAAAALIARADAVLTAEHVLEDAGIDVLARLGVQRTDADLGVNLVWLRLEDEVRSRLHRTQLDTWAEEWRVNVEELLSFGSDTQTEWFDRFAAARAESAGLLDPPRRAAELADEATLRQVLADLRETHPDAKSIPLAETERRVSDMHAAFTAVEELRRRSARTAWIDALEDALHRAHAWAEHDPAGYGEFYRRLVAEVRRVNGLSRELLVCYTEYDNLSPWSDAPPQPLVDLMRRYDVVATEPPLGAATKTRLVELLAQAAEALRPLVGDPVQANPEALDQLAGQEQTAELVVRFRELRMLLDRFDRVDDLEADATRLDDEIHRALAEVLAQSAAAPVVDEITGKAGFVRPDVVRDGPFNCAPGMAGFIGDFQERVGALRGPGLDEHPLIDLFGVGEETLARAIGGEWKEGGFKLGEAGLREVVELVRETDGAVAGAMDFGPAGAHAFGVAMGADGHVEIYEKIDGQELRWHGPDGARKWLAERAGIGVGRVFGIVLDHNGKPKTPFVEGRDRGDVIARSAPAGPIRGLFGGRAKRASDPDPPGLPRVGDIAGGASDGTAARPFLDGREPESVAGVDFEGTDIGARPDEHSDPSGNTVDGPDMDEAQPELDAYEASFRTEVAAIRRDITLLRLVSEGQEQAGDALNPAEVRSRVEKLEEEVKRRQREARDRHSRETDRFIDRLVELRPLRRGMNKLTSPGPEVARPDDSPALSAKRRTIKELTAVHGAGGPEDSDYVEVQGLLRDDISQQTAEDIVRAIDYVLKMAPQLRLSTIRFAPLEGRFAEISGGHALTIDLRCATHPDEFAAKWAKRVHKRWFSAGTGDAWVDLFLHEILGHGTDHAGVGGPDTPARARVDRHIDAAFTALTSSGEIAVRKWRWLWNLSTYSLRRPVRIPFRVRTLDNGEALAEAAVYIRGNPDSDWRSPQYALYRALYDMPILDVAEIERFRSAERQGVARPHLADGQALPAPASDGDADYARPGAPAYLGDSELSHPGAAKPIPVASDPGDGAEPETPPAAGGIAPQPSASADPLRVPPNCGPVAFRFGREVLGLEVDVPSSGDVDIRARGMSGIAVALAAKGNWEGFGSVGEMAELAASGQVVFGAVNFGGDAGGHLFVVYQDPETGVVRVHEGVGDEERDVAFADWVPPKGAVGFAGIVFGADGLPARPVDVEVGPEGEPGVDFPEWVGHRPDDPPDGGDVSAFVPVPGLRLGSEYRPLGGKTGRRMTKAEGFLVVKEAFRRNEHVEGFENHVYFAGDLVLRLAKLGVVGVDPKAFPQEHKLLEYLKRHGVGMIPEPLCVFTGRLPGGWVATPQNPAVVYRRARGHEPSLAEFWRLRKPIIEDLRTWQQQLNQVPIEPMLDLLPDDYPRTTREFVEYLVREQMRVFGEFKDAGMHKKFKACGIPEEPFAPILARLDDLVEEPLRFIHGDPIPQNIMVHQGRVSTMLDVGGMLIGPESFFWTILDHRGVAGGYVPRSLLGPNWEILKGILDIQRTIHDLARDPDPERDTTYMAAFAAARGWWGQPVRGSAQVLASAGHRSVERRAVNSSETRPVFRTLGVREEGNVYADSTKRVAENAVNKFVRHFMANWPRGKCSAAAATAQQAVAHALRDTPAGKVQVTMDSTAQPWWNRIVRITVLSTGRELFDPQRLPAEVRDWLGEANAAFLDDAHEGWATNSFSFVVRMRYFGKVSADKTIVGPPPEVAQLARWPADRYQRLGTRVRGPQLTDEETAMLFDAADTSLGGVSGVDRWGVPVGDGFWLSGDNADRVESMLPMPWHGDDTAVLGALSDEDLVPPLLQVVEGQPGGEHTSPLLLVRRRLPGYPPVREDLAEAEDEILISAVGFRDRLRSLVPESMAHLLSALPDGYPEDGNSAEFLRYQIEHATRVFAARLDIRQTTACREVLALFGVLDDPFAPVLAKANALQPRPFEMLHGKLTADNFLLANGRVSGVTGHRWQWGDPALDWASLDVSLGGGVPESVGGPNLATYRDFVHVRNVLDSIHTIVDAIGHPDPELDVEIPENLWPSLVRFRELQGLDTTFTEQEWVEALRDLRRNTLSRLETIPPENVEEAAVVAEAVDGRIASWGDSGPAPDQGGGNDGAVAKSPHPVPPDAARVPRARANEGAGKNERAPEDADQRNDSGYRLPDVATPGGVAHIEQGGPLDCAFRSLEKVRGLTGSAVIDLAAARASGMAGMHWRDLESHAGGRLRVETHAAIAERLGKARNGAVSLVVDEYQGVAQRSDGVGAHAYVMYNDKGTVMVWDPATNELCRYQDWSPPAEVAGSWAVHYDAVGTPQDTDDLGVDDGARPTSLIGAAPDPAGSVPLGIADGPTATPGSGETLLTQGVDSRGAPVDGTLGSAGYVRPKRHPRQPLVQWADWQGRPADSRPAQVRARRAVEDLFAELSVGQRAFIRRWFLADPPMSLATIAAGLDVSERAVETRVAELARALEWSDVYSCAQTVFALRPELVQLGRGVWCDQVIRHLDLFACHAGEAVRARVVHGETDEQPQTSDTPDDRLSAELPPPADENGGDVAPPPSAPPRNSGHAGGLSSRPPAPLPGMPDDAVSETFGRNWARGLEAYPVAANPFGRFGRTPRAVIDGATTHAAGVDGIEGGGLGSGKKRADAASQQAGSDSTDQVADDDQRSEQDVRDAELLDAFRAGDSSAFTTLHNHYVDYARRIARREVRNESDVEDIVAESFVILYEKLVSGDDIAHFRTYLTGTIKAIGGKLRRHTARQQLIEDTNFLDVLGLDQNPMPDAPAVSEESDTADSIVDRAMGSLPEQSRVVLRLIDIEEYTSGELASMLGSPVGEIEELVNRAREELRAALVREQLQGGTLAAALTDGEALAAVLMTGGEWAEAFPSVTAEMAVIRALRRKQLAEVRHFVEGLHLVRREWFLRWFLGQSVAEIAVEMGDPEQTVLDQLHILIRKLARGLADHDMLERQRRKLTRPRTQGDSPSLLLVEAVYAHEPDLVTACLSDLSDDDREIFRQYFDDAKTVTAIAREVSRVIVERALERITALVEPILQPDLVQRYTGGGSLRRSTREDVAAEAGVSSYWVTHLFSDEGPVSSTGRRVEAAALRLGYRNQIRGLRAGVVVEGGSSDALVPAVRARQEPSAGSTWAVRRVREMSPSDLKSLIPKLFEYDRAAAWLLFVDELPIPTVARLLDRSRRTVSDQQSLIAESLDALSSGGVLLTDSQAPELLRKILSLDPDVLAPHLSVLTEQARFRYEQHFVRGQSARWISDMTGVDRRVIRNDLVRIAQRLIKSLPTELVKYLCGGMSDGAALILVEAIAKYDSAELDPCRSTLTPIQQQYFDRYLGEGLSPSESARALGRWPRSLGTPLYRMAHAVADVATVAGVGKQYAWEVLDRGATGSEMAERIQAVAAAFGWRPERPDIVVDGPPGRSPVPSVRGAEFAVDPRWHRASRIVEGADLADRKAGIRLLPPEHQDIARLLFVDMLTADQVAQRLDVAPGRVYTMRKSLVNRLAVWLSTGVMMTEAQALLLVEAIQSRSDIVTLHRSRLSPKEQVYADLYLQQGLSANEIVDAIGGDPVQVNGMAQQLALTLVALLPPELVQRYLARGPLRRVTLPDIAAGAGVSRTMAGRIAGEDDGGFDPETVARVKAEIARFGWRRARSGIVVDTAAGVEPAAAVGMLIDGLGLPAEVVAAEILGDHTQAALLPEERAFTTAKSMADPRARESLIRRACARRALAKLGLADAQIPPDVSADSAVAKKAPRWPDGVVGGIAGTDGYHVTAVASRGRVRSIGIDVQAEEPLPDDTRGWAVRPEEMAWLAEIDVEGDIPWDRVVFSAKESVFNAWLALTGRWLGMLDVVVTVDPEAGTFTARLPAADRNAVDGGPPLPETLSGRFAVQTGIVLTDVIVWQENPSDPAGALTRPAPQVSIPHLPAGAVGLEAHPLTGPPLREQVAVAAGVSLTSISAVFNCSAKRASKATALRVLEAAQELNYAPQQRAKAWEFWQNRPDRVPLKEVAREAGMDRSTASYVFARNTRISKQTALQLLAATVGLGHAVPPLLRLFWEAQPEAVQPSDVAVMAETSPSSVKQVQHGVPTVRTKTALQVIAAADVRGLEIPASARRVYQAEADVPDAVVFPAMIAHRAGAGPRLCAPAAVDVLAEKGIALQRPLRIDADRVIANGVDLNELAEAYGADTEDFDSVDDLAAQVKPGRTVLGVVDYGAAGGHVFVLFLGKDGKVWVADFDGHRKVVMRYADWPKPTGVLSVEGIVFGEDGPAKPLGPGQSPRVGKRRLMVGARNDHGGEPERAERLTEETRSAAGRIDDVATVRAVLASAQFVLLDVDGPVCDFFAGLSAPQVSERLRQVWRDTGIEMPHDVIGTTDFLVVLRRAAEVDVELGRQVEEALRRAEVEATRSAVLTPGVRESLVELRRRGVPVVLVSNNSTVAIQQFVEDNGLEELILGVVGRDPFEVAWLKPHPQPLRVALELLGNPDPHAGVMIGDSDTDVVVANTMGMPSFGYVIKPGSAEKLARAGATALITDMHRVADNVPSRAPRDADVPARDRDGADAEVEDGVAAQPESPPPVVVPVDARDDENNVHAAVPGIVDEVLVRTDENATCVEADPPSDRPGSDDVRQESDVLAAACIAAAGWATESITLRAHVTDAGTEIAPRTWLDVAAVAPDPIPRFSRSRAGIKEQFGFNIERGIRLDLYESIGPINPHFSCHGYTFSRNGEAGCVNPSVVDRILAENGFNRVDDAGDVVPGDVVIFRKNGGVAHSGVISRVGPDGIFVDSKHGILNVTRNEVRELVGEMYGSNFEFYHTDRPDGRFLTRVDAVTLESPHWPPQQTYSDRSERTSAADVGDGSTHAPRDVASPSGPTDGVTEAARPGYGRGWPEAQQAARPTGLIGITNVSDPERRWDGDGEPWDRGPKPARGQRRIARLAQLDADGSGSGCAPDARQSRVQKSAAASKKPTSAPPPVQDVPPEDDTVSNPHADRLALSDSEYWAPVAAAIKELLALNPDAYWYMRDLPMPEPGEPFGADWGSNRGEVFDAALSGVEEELSNEENADKNILEFLDAMFSGATEKLRNVELTDKDFLELGRVIKRAPLYTTLALIVTAGLSVDQLVHVRKVGWDSLFVKQERRTRDGEVITVWKFRTMPEDEPPKSSTPDINDRITSWTKFLRATSLDELPQLLSIARGRMQYYSGRPLLDVSGEPLLDDSGQPLLDDSGKPLRDDDFFKMRRVLTDEEYAFWDNFLKNDLWSALHFPGCRGLEPQGDDYLRARYLSAFIWSRMGNRAAEEYMMEVVDSYLLSTVFRESPELLLGTGREILEGIAGLLPEESRTKLLDIAQSVFGGLAGWVGKMIRGAAGLAADFVYPVPARKTTSADTVPQQGPEPDSSAPPSAHQSTPEPSSDPPTTTERAPAEGKRLAHTEAVAIEPGTAEDLRAVLDATGYVLLDFDGPVATLFTHPRAAEVCGLLREILTREGLEIPPDVAETSDCLVVLRFAATVSPELARRVEKKLTELEKIAARSADEPTPGCVKLLEELKLERIPVVIVGKSSKWAISDYLAIHGLQDLATGGVLGRVGSNVAALEMATQLRMGRLVVGLHRSFPEPGLFVMIGDSQSDNAAAKAFGARSILYADEPRKVEEFVLANPDAVVTDMHHIAQSVSETGVTDLADPGHRRDTASPDTVQQHGPESESSLQSARRPQPEPGSDDPVHVRRPRSAEPGDIDDGVVVRFDDVPWAGLDNQCWPWLLADVRDEFGRTDIEVGPADPLTGTWVRDAEEQLGGRADRLSGMAEAVARLRVSGRVGAGMVVFIPSADGLGHAVWLRLRQRANGTVWVEFRDPARREIQRDFVAPADGPGDEVWALALDPATGRPMEMPGGPVDPASPRANFRVGLEQPRPLLG
ncbi:sigma-70 family RNA polymerase sigma factor [Nocardia sp. 2YAB30]|uniref:sigma-70 family RNA polymerase sigma factor n=1 Tax=Nocardia sp. 2YAB30 TaxID=3233022 RepID=UPI003F9A2802